MLFQRFFFKKSSPDLNEYKKSLDFLKSLTKIENIDDFDKINKNFENAIETIWKSKLSKFRLVMSEKSENWIEFMGNYIKRFGYPTTFSKVQVYDRRSNELTWNAKISTVPSVQLMKMLKKWVPEGEKIVPRDLILTPNIVPHWHIGDGETSENLIAINTQSFTIEDNKFLISLLKKFIDIDAKIYMIKYPHENSKHPKIGITGQENIKKYLEYISRANKDAVKCAKRQFPWKFDTKLNMRDYVAEKE